MWVFSTFVSVGLHAIFGWQTGFDIGYLEVWSEFWALLLDISNVLGFDNIISYKNLDILVIAREEAFTYALFAFVAAFHAMTALVTFIIADVKQLRFG